MNISKNTKIVCTIGPASDTYKTCKELYNAGMNVMRCNFSHGTYEEHQKKLEISEKLEKNDGIIMPVMLDTKGPEIRTGDFENNTKIVDAFLNAKENLSDPAYKSRVDQITKYEETNEY